MSSEEPAQWDLDRGCRELCKRSLTSSWAGLAYTQLAGQFSDWSIGLLLSQGVCDLLFGEVLLAPEILLRSNMTDSMNPGIRYGAGSEMKVMR